MLSGLFRPVAGYLADRYDPKHVALSGVVLMGAMLLLIPLVGNLVQLYVIFSVMSVGITLGAGPSLTKVVSAWFYRNRGVTLGLTTGGGSVGAIILVPAASTFLVVVSMAGSLPVLGSPVASSDISRRISPNQEPAPRYGPRAPGGTRGPGGPGRRSLPSPRGDVLARRVLWRGDPQRPLLAPHLRVLRLRILHELRECSLRCLRQRPGVPSHGGRRQL